MMETTYYRLDARRLSVCAGEEYRANSGGGTTRYAFVPCMQREEKHMGQVVDFAAYRQAAFGRGATTEHPSSLDNFPMEEQSVIPTAPKSPSALVGLVLDGCATLAIIVAVAVIVLRFFSV